VLLGFSVALVVTRGVIHTPIGVPGHSAVFWIPVLVLAGCRRMPGFVVATAICGGAMAAGIGGFRAMEFAGVLASAGVVEAFGLGRRRCRGGMLMLLAGGLGHVAKLSVKVLALAVAGVPLNHAGLPLMPTLGLYVSFGIIGGLLAWGARSGWERLRRGEGNSSKEQQ
jgi:hypothetical protein